MRQALFICLAVALAFVSYSLTTLSIEPLFRYGVAFIGYSAAIALALAASIGD